MRMHELVALCNATPRVHDELVMVKDELGKMFNIIGVTVEPSTQEHPGTVWIEVSEY